MARILRVATRSSLLALWQANYVARLLDAEIEIVPINTAGDKNRNVPIEAISGRGVFVKEVQQAVIDGRADVAVHSAKDMMSTPTPGLKICCMPERGDVRDALIGKSLDDLPPGGSVATGSVRRRAQMAELRPDLTFFGLRGNVDTRIKKVGEFDSIVMAAAPLVRLEMNVDNAHILSPNTMLPQVGQGALAVECRDDDRETYEWLQTVEHADTRRAVDAERSFLAELGGGCDLPVACYATIENDLVFMRGLIASLDGHVVLRKRASAMDGIALGAEMAKQLLVNSGGAELLEAQRTL